MTIGVAVIGVGAPWHHLPALSRLPDVALVGLCDVDEVRLKQAGQAYGVDKLFTEYGVMLDHVAPQAVFVLPSVLHTVEAAKHCLDRGLHVFVEKPPGIHAGETRELARLARTRRVLSMVGFNRRFHPLVTAARDAITPYRPPSAIVVEWWKPLLMDDMGRSFPIPVLEHLLSVTTIHSIDLLRFLGGEVVSIQALGGRHYSPYLDAVHALLRFQIGGTGILLSDYHTTKYERLQVHGRGWLVELSGRDAPYREGRIFKDGVWMPLVTAAGDRTDPDGFFDEDQHFIACVAAGRPVGPHGSDLEDAVRTMELAEAIEAAARSSIEVTR